MVVKVVHCSRVLDIVDLVVRIPIHILDTVDYYMMAVFWPLAVRSLGPFGLEVALWRGTQPGWHQP